MAQFEYWMTTDLKRGSSQVQVLHGETFTQDNLGNRVGVVVMDGNTPAALSGTVTGYVIRADGNTVVQPGAIDGNKAYIDLPESAYAVPGQIQIAIRLTSGTTKTVLAALTAYVRRTATGTIIDPGHVVPDIDDIIAKLAEVDAAIAAAQTATSAANTAATETSRVNIQQSKTGNVITVTTTNRNNQQTSNTLTDPSGMIAPEFSASTAYSAGDYVAYNGALYVFTADHTAVAWTGTDVREASVTGELADLDARKAETDGYYEEMTVGDAEQLIATQYAEDSTPYQFRATGGTADVGNREYLDKIVGGTVVWNQLLDNGNFDSSARWSVSANDSLTIANHVATFRASARYHSIVQGTQANEFLPQANHVYLGFITAKSYTNSNTFFYIRNVANATVVQTAQATLSNTLKFVAKLIKLNQTGSQIQFMIQDNNASDFGDITVENAQMFDLTQMFGSTIADYIYSLEQATEGAGVAWFRKLFPGYYFDKNLGELMSVEGLSAHETVGFNQWDEEWEAGTISTNGENAVDGSFIRSKNYIPVLGNTTYYFKCPMELRLFYYDESHNFISFYGNVSSQTFITPVNCRYLRFRPTSDYGTTYKNDICINLSWTGTRNDEYEPYAKHAYPLDSSLTLRGIPKIDASGNLYYDGDEYEADGTVTRKYRVLTLNGSESWGIEAAGWMPAEGLNSFYYSLGSGNLPVYVGTMTAVKAISNRLSVRAYNYYRNSNAQPNWLCFTGGNGAYIDISSTLTTVEEFKSWLQKNPVTIIYELATPTTETADPFQQVQICDDYGTEEFVTTSIVPVGHETRYPANLRDKLQHLPSLAAANGTYAVQQTGMQMSLVPMTTPTELPAAPTTDGAYKLRVTVASGEPTYTWEAET